MKQAGFNGKYWNGRLGGESCFVILCGDKSRSMRREVDTLGMSSVLGQCFTTFMRNIHGR